MPHAPRDRSGSPGPDPLLILAAGAVGVFVLAALWVWATAMIAGRVYGGAWPSLSVGAAGAALVRLVGEPGLPAAAFPRDVAALLPGATPFYAVAGALALAPWGLLVSGAVAWRAWRFREPRSPAPEPTARWATRKDLHPLVVAKPTSGRLTLGRVDGRLIAAEPLQSVCLFGPTRSGKTTAFAIPAVMEWDGPAIVCSVKTDIAAVTMDHRQSIGQVKVFDPLGLTPWPASQWSPLGRVRSWGDARRVAFDIARVSQASHGLTQSDFWLESAADLMAPLFFAAARGGFDMSDVVRWVQMPQQSVPEVMETLEQADVIEAVAAFQAVLEDDSKTRSNIYTTTRQFLGAFADPTVAESSRRCEITPAWLHDGPGANTLYLCAPSHDQDRLRPLFVSLLQDQIRKVYEWQQATSEALQRPLLVVLDEAANIAAMPDIDHLASTCAGHGIQLLTIFQDLAQVRARWGDRAQTVVNNHRATVLLSGTKDDSMLRYAAGLVGEEEVIQETTTRSAGSNTVTESIQFRQLAPPNGLRQMRPDSALLLYWHMPPAVLELH